MIARELISPLIPPLKPTDRGSKVLTWMEELRVNQLPVIKESKFIGLITEEVLLEGNDIDLEVKDYRIIAENCYVKESQHLFDVLKAATDHGVEVVAVLDDDDSFEGVITVQDTIRAFAKTSAVQSPGGILILSMNQVDYSLTEVARLIESNDAKILSSSVSSDLQDPAKIKLTIKINMLDMSRIVATLERFGYNIIGKFQEPGMINNDRERFDILLKYLDL